jgi:hypothetical protein
MILQGTTVVNTNVFNVLCLLLSVGDRSCTYAATNATCNPYLFETMGIAAFRKEFRFCDAVSERLSLSSYGLIYLSC